MSNPITPLKRFYNLLRVDKKDIVSIYIYAIFHGLVSLSLPLGIQAIINFLTGARVSTSWILLVVFVIIGVAFNGVLKIMQLSITENLQQKIFTRSAFEFAYRIPRLKLESVDKSHLPDLVNRFFDTLSVQKGLSKVLMDFSGASLQILFGLMLLSLYHPFFIIFSMVCLGIIYLIFRFTGPNGLKTSLLESKEKYRVAYWLEEIGLSLETFKLAGDTKLHLHRTDDNVSNYLTSRKAHFRTLLIQYINLVGFKVVVAAGLLVIGGLLVFKEQMNIGQFVASEIIIILVISSVEKLIQSMETIYDVLTSVEKIGAIMDLPLESSKGARVDVSKPGLSVSVKDLTYKFPKETTAVLKNINVSIKAGEKLCISGVDGAGKSAMLQMLAGLYSDFSGGLNYNGIPVGNWCKEELYNVIGENLKNEVIFSGTIMENITLGRPGVEEEHVREAVSVVGLSQFVEDLSKGLATEIGAEGNKLPQSAKLRVLLARAIVIKPKLLLLEESFNNLNVYDREHFMSYLLASEGTVVVVSNDENVVRKFNRNLLLEDGGVVYDGDLNQCEFEDKFLNLFKNKR